LFKCIGEAIQTIVICNDGFETVSKILSLSVSGKITVHDLTGNQRKDLEALLQFESILVKNC